MSEYIKGILAAQILIFTLSIIFYVFLHKKSYGVKFYNLGILGQMVFLLIILSKNIPLVPTWAYQSQVLVLYLFIFNIIIFPYLRKRSINLNLPIGINILFSVIILFLFEPRYLDSEIPPIFFSYTLKLFTLLTAVTFALVLLELFISFYDKEIYPRISRNLTLSTLVFWIFSLVSYSLWANFAWGRYWSWDNIELKLLTILLLLIACIYIELFTKKVGWKLVILFIVFLLLTFPLLEFFVTNHGSYM